MQESKHVAAAAYRFAAATLEKSQMDSTTSPIDLATDAVIGLEDNLTATATGLLSRIAVGDDESDQLLSLFLGMMQARQALKTARDSVQDGRAAA